MGALVEEFEDGVVIPGRQSLKGTTIQTYRDHRIAMAFTIAGLLAKGPTIIDGAECTAISFPGFFETLERVKG
jgi:3-phosphoshikimate 1-carboxyvinyltransferase